MSMMNLPKIIKLENNRVRRNYLGGMHLDEVQGIIPPGVSDKPEEWIASIIPASNPGLATIENEGLSYFLQDGRKKFLREQISEAPEYYLGKDYYSGKGIDLGFLAKILDSSMRLHVQAHPDKGFARKYLGSKYGKLECYYILSTGQTEEGYIRLGFQHLEGREEWKRIIEEQDLKAMDAVFDDVPVHAGEIWYIPGGMPHAIGKDIVMIEIMEPSDLVVRCEFQREGITVPPEGRFMGKDLDFCLNIFDYSNYSIDEVRQKCMVSKRMISEGCFRLVDDSLTDSFRVQLHKIKGKGVLEKGLARALINVDGDIKIRTDAENVGLSKWQSAFAAANQDDYIVEGSGTLIEIQSVL